MERGNIKILVGGTIIDGNGGNPIKGQAIIIDGTRIKDIVGIDSISNEMKRNSVLFEVSGQYIMPGFIDAHTHIQLCGRQPEIQILKESIPKKTLRAAANASSKRAVSSSISSVTSIPSSLAILTLATSTGVMDPSSK